MSLREAIIEVLAASSKPVTVRQVFYLLSVRGAVDKTEAGYRQAARQLLALRREELIDYSWIADNTRWHRKPVTYNGLADCLADTAAYYRKAVWQDLPDYTEVWCEKDALAGVIVQETRVFDVPLLVARGYTSETFAYEAARAMPLQEKTCYVYHLGDLDPSGWDASRDLREKLDRFTHGAVHFERLAVTPEQIEWLDLPTRPSKKKDSRHARFEREFGKGAPSVELDAIPPDILRALVRVTIEQHIPAGHLERLRTIEQEERHTLERLRFELAEEQRA